MTKNNILIIGASGLLGTALHKELSIQFPVVGTYCSHPFPSGIRLDMENNDELLSMLSHHSPGCVVLAAANPRVDAYEHDPTISEKQIVSAKIIANWCSQNGSQLVFVSSDAVFDGTAPPYDEQSEPNPISAYGKNKYAIEKTVSSVKKHTIIRISVLYGLPLFQGGFINKAIAKIASGKEITAITDWVKTPTLTTDVGIALRHLLKKNCYGTFHVAGKTSLSMFDAAKVIAREFSQPESLVKPISFVDLRLPAARGKNTSLSTKKINEAGIFTRSFEDGIHFIHTKMKKVND